MRLLNFLFIFLSGALSYTTTNNSSNFNTTRFMHINNGCLMDSNFNFSCIYVTQLIWMDPIMKADLEYVCDKCKQRNFTNNQLAKIVNKRFNDTKLNNCTVTTIDNLGSMQLVDQCPYLYKEFCS